MWELPLWLPPAGFCVQGCRWPESLFIPTSPRFWGLRLAYRKDGIFFGMLATLIKWYFGNIILAAETEGGKWASRWLEWFVPLLASTRKVFCQDYCLERLNEKYTVSLLGGKSCVRCFTHLNSLRNKIIPVLSPGTILSHFSTSHNWSCYPFICKVTFCCLRVCAWDRVLLWQYQEDLELTM